MIKLINLLELEVNSPNITKEEVYKFWNEKINKTTEGLDILWTEYIKMRTPYVEKYIPNNLNPKTENSERLIRTLPQSALNSFYGKMKQLVKKHSINELEINDPNKITFIPLENVHNWIYKGGNDELDLYIQGPGYKIMGALIYNKWIFSCSALSEAADDRYICFNSKYFVDDGRSYWFDNDIDLSDNPIIISNIRKVG